MFIRITTDTGLRGFAPGPADERAHRVIRGEIGPFLEGKDPRRWNAFAFTGSAASERVYRAVEIALMDAAARRGLRALGSDRREGSRSHQADGSAGMHVAGTLRG